MARRRFPEFDLVAFRVDDPAELAVFRLLGLVEHIAALCAQLANEGVEVCDPLIHHK